MQALVETPIATYLPSEVVYSDGSSAVLSEDYVLMEGNLKLYVPKERIEEVIKALKEAGFREVRQEGDELYSLSVKFYDIWELHIRVYRNGFITSHFELSRDLFQLNYPTVPSVYEPFEFYKVAYDRFHLYDAVARKWVKDVLGNYLVTLNPPHDLTAWRPIKVVHGVLAGVGIIGYALSRLEEGRLSEG